MWQQVDYFLSFFLYTLSGKVYRQELRKGHCEMSPTVLHNVTNRLYHYEKFFRSADNAKHST